MIFLVEADGIHRYTIRQSVRLAHLVSQGGKRSLWTFLIRPELLITVPLRACRIVEAARANNLNNFYCYKSLTADRVKYSQCG